MTQEDKKLLLIDLCARLPYGVKVQTEVHDTAILEPFYLDQHEYLHPIAYLRPMSSMTEEEEFILDETRCWTQLTLESYDWLLEHHFDFRGLIEKNLALDCTGLHIYD